MPSRVPDIQLDHVHSTAICEAVGEILRDALNRETPDTPQRLRRLMDRLPELDSEHSPSIAPDSGSR